MTITEMINKIEKPKINLSKLSDYELDELYRNIRYELELRGMEK